MHLKFMESLLKLHRHSMLTKWANLNKWKDCFGRAFRFACLSAWIISMPPVKHRYAKYVNTQVEKNGRQRFSHISKHTQSHDKMTHLLIPKWCAIDKQTSIDVAYKCESIESVRNRLRFLWNQIWICCCRISSWRGRGRLNLHQYFHLRAI